MRTRVLIRKLNYLRRVVTADEDKLYSLTFKFFAGRDVSKRTIVEQCRYLEGVYCTNFTGEVLTTTVSQRYLQKRVLTEFRLRELCTHQSLKHITAVPKLSWLKIWDMALDHGARGTRPLCHFSKLSLGHYSATDSVHTIIYRSNKIELTWNI